jgi:hypothetical protein
VIESASRRIQQSRPSGRRPSMSNGRSRTGTGRPRPLWRGLTKPQARPPAPSARDKRTFQLSYPHPNRFSYSRPQSSVLNDLAAWLVGLLANAGRKKLTALVLGSEQERAWGRPTPLSPVGELRFACSY